eukprot:g2755.t1
MKEGQSRERADTMTDAASVPLPHDKGGGRSSSFQTTEYALAACNLLQYSAMMADQAAGANYQNYLHMAGGSKERVVSLMSKLASLTQIVSFAFNPLMGNLSDRWGRKFVLVASQLSMAVGWYLREAKQYTNLQLAMPLIVIVRCVHGLLYGAFMHTRLAALGDVFSGERLALANSSLNASMGLAYVLGPYMFVKYVGRSVQRAFRVRIIAAVGNALILALFFKETMDSSSTRRIKRVRNSNDGKVLKDIGKIFDPFSFTKLFTHSRALAFFTVAQAFQKLATPVKSLSQALTWHVHQVLKLSPSQNAKRITGEGLGLMMGNRLTKYFLPLMGTQNFVLFCNAALALMLLMRASARDSGHFSKRLFALSLIPLVAGQQNMVAVDSAVMSEGVACGIPQGELSAMLDNVNVGIGVFAPIFWGKLFQRSKFLAMKVAAAITMLSYVPYYLGQREQVHAISES